jgi:deoxyribodipyrimidine photo-lyase
VLWLRRDLRRQDHPAMVEACRLADGGPVYALFVVDEALLAPAGPTRVAYLTATLQALATEVPLTLREGDPAIVVGAFAREVGARHVVVTADAAPYGRQRDRRVADQLREDDVTLVTMASHYVVPPGSVYNKSNEPFKVFTPFRKTWEQFAQPDPLPAPEGTFAQRDGVGLERLLALAGQRRPDYFGDLPDDPPTLPPAGEAAAHAALRDFATHVDAYQDERNTPGVEGTSRLSPFLRFGVLHPRQVLHATRGTSEGRRHYESEIAWREFYADVLFHRPDSVREVLQPVMNRLRLDTGPQAEERFRTWARGETGYPLVDAGMRQLLATGWMHNRVRMVAASFLVKHLHLDWRWGARWFMWRLIDGDVASNQHGWQWTAGTGTDAAPYHRIFNPTLQAERFDPQGDFVRAYLPELAGLSAPQCLQPGAGEGLLRPEGYPAPMIDAAHERDEALARFAEARGVTP